MSPKEALEIIRTKITLPEGVSARIDPKQPTGVMVGTLDLMFFLDSQALSYDEDFLIQITNKSLKHVQDAIAVHEKEKADRAAAAALVKAQQDKAKRKK